MTAVTHARDRGHAGIPAKIGRRIAFQGA